MSHEACIFAEQNHESERVINKLSCSRHTGIWRMPCDETADGIQPSAQAERDNVSSPKNKHPALKLEKIIEELPSTKARFAYITPNTRLSFAWF